MQFYRSKISFLCINICFGPGECLIVNACKTMFDIYIINKQIVNKSTHILLNLLYKVGKAIKCQACRAFYPLLQQFTEVNNTGAYILDSIYHDIALKEL